MENRDKERKFVPVRDFIYLCVILVIILIAVISYFLGDSPRAGENLNFGATAVSIVLAVIAIIMTIVDAAGQKNNVFDLKKSIETLEKSIRKEQKLVDGFKEQLEIVENSRINLMEEINNIVSLREEIKNLIKSSSEEGSPASIDIEHLNNVFKKFDNNGNIVGKFVFFVKLLKDENFEEKIEEFNDFINQKLQKQIEIQSWEVNNDGVMEIKIKGTFYGKEALANKIRNTTDAKLLKVRNYYKKALL